MRTSILRQLGLGSLLLLLPILSLAHTGLKQSTPAADATVKTPPAAIELEFSAPVRLVRVEVMGEGHEMPAEFAPQSEPAAAYSVKTPGMHPGKFTVNWAAVGADGHTLTSSFSFTVDPASAGSAP